VDKSLEIKISTLIKRVESLEKNVMIMIRILNPDLDLSINQTPDHDQSRINDPDPRARETDEDLILWFCEVLQSFGIDPSHRQWSERTIKSIRYYHANYENIKNKQKYAASFLPPQTKQAEVRPADDEKAFGYPLETLNAAAEKLSKPIIDNLVAQDESLRLLTTKLLGGKLPNLVKLKLAKEALERGLIQQ